MVYVLAVLCALLAIAVLLLLWKLWLLRRSAEELRRGVQELPWWRENDGRGGYSRRGGLPVAM